MDMTHLSRNERRAMRKDLAKDNEQRPHILTKVPPERWAHIKPDPKRIECWWSKKYLVQVFQEPDGVIRISCNRTVITVDGQWDDGLTWDELQTIKRDVGRGHCYAIEIYPETHEVVNVANMRHLWLLPAPLSCGWRRSATVS